MTDYEFTVQHIRNPILRESDKFEDTSDSWLVKINGQGFDYYTGRGHRKLKKNLLSAGYAQHDRHWLKKNLHQLNFDKFIAITKPTPPSLDDVLYSLVTDSRALDTCFIDWCADFGYDTDSRKAESIYRACQENAFKLRKAGVDINAERERLADY